MDYTVTKCLKFVLKVKRYEKQKRQVTYMCIVNNGDELRLPIQTIMVIILRYCINSVKKSHPSKTTPKL